MTETAKRTLILLRHAKSDWPEGVPDRERPLAGRGRRDAPKAGRWLRRHGYLPDYVICSNALRTRQTWELAAAGLSGSARTVRFEPRAYAASARTLLYLVRELPPQCRTALVIAHNPGISELAGALVQAEGTTGGTSARVTGFPTTGMAVLTLTCLWPDLAPGSAELTAFVVPADM